MRRIPRALLPHTVTLEAPLGEDGTGERWADPVTCRAYAEDKPNLIFSEGTQVTSTTKVWLDLDAPAFIDGYCTVWSGTPRERRALILSVARFDHPKAPSHLEAYLA